MKTKKLYAENVYLSSSDATVVKIDDNRIALDGTIFFPTGGGQSCDLGYIQDFEVTDVSEDENFIWHTLVNHNLKVGDTVKCQIDWARRFDNMQRHCGEHIMSGMWHREYGGVNRGFHMGDEYMTVDISLEKMPQYKEVTWEMAMHIENCTNEAIWANLPVTTMHFDTKKEAAKLPMRKELSINKDITLVCVGDISNPSDCVACCGTHPATSGQVGLLKIYKVEKNKGMFRIYFEAGKRAAEDYASKHELVQTLGNKYSTGTDGILKKIKAQEEKYSALKNQHAVLRDSVIEIRKKEIIHAIETNPAEICIYKYNDMTVDDLLNIGRPIMDQVKKLLMIVEQNSNTVLLFSDGNVDCGKLVKENASIYNGKGGGSNQNARAIFATEEMAELYIDLITKHLK